MPVTQAHILMLASVSIFTGMIAPGAANHEISQPYALTNIQYIAFIVLFVLSGLFLASNLRMKKTSHALSALLILLIILLAVMTALGIVKSFSGLVLSSFHWGWFFLMSGFCLLAFSVIKSAAFDREKWENPYEKIMGITGFLVLLILTSFVITVAILNQKKGKNISELTKIFTGTEISSFSGITISPAFRKIEHFSANRAKNIFSFVGYNSSNSAFLYPEKLPLSDPFSIEKIIRVAKNIYFVKKDGSVFRGQQKVGKYIPPADEKSAHNFLFLQVSDDKYCLITDNFYEEYTIPAQKIDGVFFDNSSQMLYSRVSSPNGQAIYRGENRVTKEYHSILRFAISREGNILFVLEKENGEKMIVLDEKNQYALREDYVPGTFQTNGIDTLYAIKNLEDSSFSVVFNGVVLERKLDEIRDMFLSEKSNFGYFWRLQGSSQYCYFSRDQDNICHLRAYMNPKKEADGLGVIFLGLKDKKWDVYRENRSIVENLEYSSQENISNDYFFFDPTNARRFIIAEKTPKGFIFYKNGQKKSENWIDFDEKSVYFGYEKIFITVRDTAGWRIVEL